MTAAQRARFFGDWWPRIAAMRGVPPNDRGARHAFYAEAGLGAVIDHKRGFDLLKAHCLAVLDDANLGAQVLQQRQPTRRRHWKIDELLRCLALYPRQAGGEPMGLAGAEAYALEIVRDKFNRGSVRQITAIEDLDDKPRTRVDSRGDLIELPSQVQQLIMDLSRNLNQFRNAAGDTIHQMKTSAQVRCTCAACRRQTARRVRAAAPEMAAANEPF